MPDFRENLGKILLLFIVIAIILTFANAILSILRMDLLLLLFVVIAIIMTFAVVIILSILRNLLRKKSSAH